MLVLTVGAVNTNRPEVQSVHDIALAGEYRPEAQAKQVENDEAPVADE